jgi:hypothetical protein
MSIRSNTERSASPPPGTHRNHRNGQLCPRCKRFGTFAPNSIVCDRCTGALPLIFVLMVTVVIGGGR